MSCHVSFVTCHMSCIRFQVSHIMCQHFFLQSDRASYWRVCHQRGLPHLVFVHTNFCFLVPSHTYFIQMHSITYNKLSIILTHKYQKYHNKLEPSYSMSTSNSKKVTVKSKMFWNPMKTQKPSRIKTSLNMDIAQIC